MPVKSPNSRLFVALPALLFALQARASFLSGEALDTAADMLAWTVLIIAPVVVIAVFLMVHILPEKIAEKRKHPQLGAIKTLCLLSLVFGGMLWPIAWIWAYTRPVFHKIAYGTDVADEHGGVVSPAALEPAELKSQPKPNN